MAGSVASLIMDNTALFELTGWRPTIEPAAGAAHIIDEILAAKVPAHN